jgi:cell wall-associated NlpC family hydrolase
MSSMAVAAMRRRRFAAAAALVAALLGPAAAVATAAAPAAQAAVSHSGAATAYGGSAAASAYGGSAAGNAALNWAERYATGCWYYYGGTGCSPGYDCSGLVMEAFGYGAGIWLPHSTYAMLSDPHLHPIPLSQARRGDLMFYGDGHVEINTIWYHTTFGAHDTGQQVGWITWGPWWYPTAAYRVS